MQHQCNYDWQADAQKLLALQNPKVQAAKLERMCGAVEPRARRGAAQVAWRARGVVGRARRQFFFSVQGAGVEGRGVRAR